MNPQIIDVEAKAISDVVSCLTDLSPEQAYRVLSNVCDRYDIGIFPPGMCRTPSLSIREQTAQQEIQIQAAVAVEQTE